MAAVQRQLVHKQFNSPIGLYSDQNVKETLDRELKAFSNGASGIGLNDTSIPLNLANSSVLKMVEEEEAEKYPVYRCSRESRPRYHAIDRETVLKINRRHRKRDHSWPPQSDDRVKSYEEIRFDENVHKREEIFHLKEMFDRGAISNENDRYIIKTKPKRENITTDSAATTSQRSSSENNRNICLPSSCPSSSYALTSVLPTSLQPSPPPLKAYCSSPSPSFLPLSLSPLPFENCENSKCQKHEWPPKTYLTKDNDQKANKIFHPKQLHNGTIESIRIYCEKENPNSNDIIIPITPTAATITSNIRKGNGNCSNNRNIKINNMNIQPLKRWKSTDAIANRSRPTTDTEKRRTSSLERYTGIKRGSSKNELPPLKPGRISKKKLNLNNSFDIVAHQNENEKIKQVKSDENSKIDQKDESDIRKSSAQYQMLQEKQPTKDGINKSHLILNSKYNLLLDQDRNKLIGHTDGNEINTRTHKKTQHNGVQLLSYLQPFQQSASSTTDDHSHNDQHHHAVCCKESRIPNRNAHKMLPVENYDLTHDKCDAKNSCHSNWAKNNIHDDGSDIGQRYETNTNCNWTDALQCDPIKHIIHPTGKNHHCQRPIPPKRSNSYKICIPENAKKSTKCDYNEQHERNPIKLTKDNEYCEYNGSNASTSPINKYRNTSIVNELVKGQKNETNTNTVDMSQASNILCLAGTTINNVTDHQNTCENSEAQFKDRTAGTFGHDNEGAASVEKYQHDNKIAILENPAKNDGEVITINTNTDFITNSSLSCGNNENKREFRQGVGFTDSDYLWMPHETKLVRKLSPLQSANFQTPCAPLALTTLNIENYNNPCKSQPTKDLCKINEYLKTSNKIIGDYELDLKKHAVIDSENYFVSNISVPVEINIIGDNKSEENFHGVIETVIENLPIVEQRLINLKKFSRLVDSPTEAEISEHQIIVLNENETHVKNISDGTETWSSTIRTTTPSKSLTVGTPIDKIIQSKNIQSGFLITKQKQEQLFENSQIQASSMCPHNPPHTNGNCNYANGIENITWKSPVIVDLANGKTLQATTPTLSFKETDDDAKDYCHDAINHNNNNYDDKSREGATISTIDLEKVDRDGNDPLTIIHTAKSLTSDICKNFIINDKPSHPSSSSSSTLTSLPPSPTITPPQLISTSSSPSSSSTNPLLPTIFPATTAIITATTTNITASLFPFSSMPKTEVYDKPKFYSSGDAGAKCLTFNHDVQLKASDDIINKDDKLIEKPKARSQLTLVKQDNQETDTSETSQNRCKDPKRDLNQRYKYQQQQHRNSDADKMILCDNSNPMSAIHFGERYYYCGHQHQSEGYEVIRNNYRPHETRSNTIIQEQDEKQQREYYGKRELQRKLTSSDGNRAIRCTTEINRDTKMDDSSHAETAPLYRNKVTNDATTKNPPHMDTVDWYCDRLINRSLNTSTEDIHLKRDTCLFSNSYHDNELSGKCFYANYELPEIPVHCGSRGFRSCSQPPPLTNLKITDTFDRFENWAGRGVMPFRQNSFDSCESRYYASPNLYMTGHFQPAKGYRRVAWPPAEQRPSIKAFSPQPPSIQPPQQQHQGSDNYYQPSPQRTLSPYQQSSQNQPPSPQAQQHQPQQHQPQQHQPQNQNFYQRQQQQPQHQPTQHQQQAAPPSSGFPPSSSYPSQRQSFPRGPSPSTVSFAGGIAQNPNQSPYHQQPSVQSQQPYAGVGGGYQQPQTQSPQPSGQAAPQYNTPQTQPRWGWSHVSSPTPTRTAYSQPQNYPHQSSAPPPSYAGHSEPSYGAPQQQQYQPQSNQAFQQPPMSNQPLQQPPYQTQPQQQAGQRPYSQQPYNQQPYNQQPYNQQPYNQQPYNQQPYNQQPYTHQPQSQSPYQQPPQSYQQQQQPPPQQPYQQTNQPQSFNQSQQPYYPQANQLQQNQDNCGQGPPGGVITLRREPPISQKPAPVFTSQPAAASFGGGANMRGDLKWPPDEYKVQAAEENEARRQLALGPACRPRRMNKDYTGFFAKHALNSTYPGYKAPPGTQHMYVSY